MDIRLNLSKHCIETELRKQYNRAVSFYFKAGTEEKHHLEQTIELIRRALENLNFSQLRSRYPPLAGGTDRDVVLSCLKNDLTLTIDGKELKD